METKLDWLVTEAMAPCFVEELDEQELTAVIKKVNEALTEKEIDLLGRMVSRAVNLAYKEGVNN